MKTVDLPPPRTDCPMVVHVISDAIIDDPDKGDKPVWWVVSCVHPYIPGVNVMRMFAGPDGVEVYSTSVDGRTCIRDVVPTRMIRLVQESMPLDVFISEIRDAESDDGDDDDDDGYDDEGDGPQVPAPAAAAPSPNGQI